jgi:hypothetical protein
MACDFVRSGDVESGFGVLVNALGEIVEALPANDDAHDLGCACPGCGEPDECDDGPDYAYEREHSAARLG